MKSYKLLLINLFLCLTAFGLRAQCTTQLSVKNVLFNEAQLGQIQLEVKHDASLQKYSLKVYQINSEVTQVAEESQRPVNNTLSIKGLAQGTYWVRLDWGNNCSTTVGGLDGITVGPNEVKP